jgi:hypothetical protein
MVVHSAIVFVPLFPQHVAHVRWLEVPSAERRPLVSLFLQLLGSSGRPEEPWAIKSRAAALVAEVIRQEGPALWQEVLPPLRTMALEGPAPAETVAMLLRWLPEDVTVHNEDLDGEAGKEWLKTKQPAFPQDAIMDNASGACVIHVWDWDDVSIWSHADSLRTQSPVSSLTSCVCVGSFVPPILCDHLPVLCTEESRALVSLVVCSPCLACAAVGPDRQPGHRAPPPLRPGLPALRGGHGGAAGGAAAAGTAPRRRSHRCPGCSRRLLRLGARAGPGVEPPH